MSSSRSGQWTPSPWPIRRQLLRSLGVAWTKRGYQASGVEMTRPSLRSAMSVSSVTVTSCMVAAWSSAFISAGLLYREMWNPSPSLPCYAGEGAARPGVRPIPIPIGLFVASMVGRAVETPQSAITKLPGVNSRGVSPSTAGPAAHGWRCPRQNRVDPGSPTPWRLLGINRCWAERDAPAAVQPVGSWSRTGASLRSACGVCRPRCPGLGSLGICSGIDRLRPRR